MAVYVIAIIPMILMIVDITVKIDDSTETAAYVDDVTTCSWKSYSVKELLENALHARPQIRALPKSIEIMVNFKRKS